jgi:predicted GIY-YIG superfamily endonuclease
VYILRCADDSLYVDETSDVSARLAATNDGRGSSFTASRRPVSVVLTEMQESRDAAQVRERQLKRWTKEALIAGDVERLKRL